MNDKKLLQRIVIDPKIKAGKPVIHGTRLTVGYILNRLARGDTEADVLTEYEGLTKEDIRACWLFAAEAVKGKPVRNILKPPSS